MSSSRPSTASSSTTTSKLEQTLNANLLIQKQIKAKLIEVSNFQIQNRARKSLLLNNTISAPLLNTTSPSSSRPKHSRKLYTDYGRALHKLSGSTEPFDETRQTTMLHRKWSSPAVGINQRIICNNNKNNNDNKKIKANSQEGRLWKARFFVDPDGSVPADNTDTVTRRKLLQNVPTDSESTHKLSDVKHLSKDQCLKILEIVLEYNGHPRWDDVAREVSLLKNESDARNDENVTPWQCFQYYQRYLNTHSNTPCNTNDHDNTTSNQVNSWTQVEDEYLLAFMLSKDPTFVFDMAACEDICKQVLFNKSAHDVHIRIHQTLINPKLSNKKWTEEDEKKLVILMKVFQNDKSPVSACLNFFPDRSLKQIFEKWTRHLDPSCEQQYKDFLYDKRCQFKSKSNQQLLKANEDLLKRKMVIRKRKVTQAVIGPDDFVIRQSKAS